MPSTFERPMNVLSAGLTLKAFALKVYPSHLSVILADGSEITLHLTNCFCNSRESRSYVDDAGRVIYSDDDRWSLAEQSIIEAAVAETISRQGYYHVTLPIPARSAGWWDALNEKSVPFAGYLWLDDQTTLQSLLISSGNRRETPVLPMQAAGLELPAPTRRPSCGLTAPCKVLASDKRADSWWIQMDAAFEVLVRLIDCYAAPIQDAGGNAVEEGIAAYRRAVDYLYWPNAKLSCTIPMLEGGSSWWRGLTTRTEQPAYLWINEHSLNHLLVRQQVASSRPPTALKHDLRCA